MRTAETVLQVIRDMVCKACHMAIQYGKPVKHHVSK